MSTGGLRRGNTHSCGKLSCRQPQYVNHVGERFGRLTATKVAGYQGPRKQTLWECKCDCGSVTTVRAETLVGGRTKSCGCLQKETASRNGKRRILPNGEASRRALVGAYKKNARIRGIMWGLSEERLNELFRGKCFYCGGEPHQTHKNSKGGEGFVYNGVDRLDSAKGYVDGNVVSSCSTCNYAKRVMTYEEFVAWIHRAHSHLKEGRADV